MPRKRRYWVTLMQETLCHSRLTWNAHLVCRWIQREGNIQTLFWEFLLLSSGGLSSFPGKLWPPCIRISGGIFWTTCQQKQTLLTSVLLQANVLGIQRVYTDVHVVVSMAEQLRVFHDGWLANSSGCYHWWIRRYGRIPRGIAFSRLPCKTLKFLPPCLSSHYFFFLDFSSFLLPLYQSCRTQIKRHFLISHPLSRLKYLLPPLNIHRYTPIKRY